MVSLTKDTNIPTLKIVSLNTKGLNTPEKRSKLLLTMHRLHANIVLLQETHFRSDNTPKLSNAYFPTALHATNPKTKTKGVSILIAKNCPFTITDSITDPDGRYLFLKGSIHNKTVTLANIYAPNKHQVPFFRSITEALTTFQEGTLILGGDFNVTLNPIQDTSTNSTTLPYKALKTIKSLFQRLLLHDTWRTLNPDTKDYTFYSKPHNRYSRIDYLFLTQNDLPLLYRTSIEPMTISDHHPISMTLQIPDTTPHTRIWRLDSSLLTDPTIAKEVDATLRHFFLENNPEDTSHINNWEAHKSVIRGTFLAAAAKRNKERRKHHSDLLEKIRKLEGLHKQSQALTTLTDLIQARKDLLDLLDKQIQRKYILSKKKFYEFGNKASKMLAKALQVSRSNKTIHHITDPSGRKLTKTLDIARQFVQYYSKLYNLASPTTATDSSTRPQMISEFLKQYIPNPISESIAQELNTPLTLTEVKNALKQMKAGKSPGPDGLTAGYYKTYANLLTPHFLKAFNSFAQPINPPRDLLTAHITVIPKPDKVPP